MHDATGWVMTTSERREAFPVSMLSRVSAILDAFSTRDDELSLAELTVRTGIPKPSVYRISKDLVEADMLERSPRGFRLGIKLFELGELVNGPRRLRDIALPYLEELYELTHEVVNLGALQGTDVLYFLKIVGHQGMFLPTRVGGRWPAHATALGKIMLAYGPSYHVAQVMAAGLEQLTQYTITEPHRLLRHLEGIRRRRTAFDLEESALGVVCVAAPIRVDGVLVAGLSISGPSSRGGPERWEAAVKRVSCAISRKLSTETVLQDSTPGRPL